MAMGRLFQEGRIVVGLADVVWIRSCDGHVTRVRGVSGGFRIYIGPVRLLRELSMD